MQGNNPKDRYGLAKVPFSLIPPTANVFLAMGLKIGAKKYGPYNWRTESVQGRVYLEAAYRHLLLLLDGEDFDRDTGIHHGAFILSTVAIYLDAMVQGKLIDNRPLAGATGKLVAFFNELPGTEKSIEDLVAGFKALVPNGHFGDVWSSSTEYKPGDRVVIRSSRRGAQVLGQLSSPTKRASRKRPTYSDLKKKAPRHAHR